MVNAAQKNDLMNEWRNERWVTWLTYETNIADIGFNSRRLQLDVEIQFGVFYPA